MTLVICVYVFQLTLIDITVVLCNGCLEYKVREAKGICQTNHLRPETLVHLIKRYTQ
jgi:hypothetical protein